MRRERGGGCNNAAVVTATIPDVVGSECDLTIVLPCLNEAETLAVCIRKSLESFRRLGINGEVVVADNGSTDGSQAIGVSEGARVVSVPQKGYGAALKGGIEAARGRYVLMADADDSYALDDIGGFVVALDSAPTWSWGTVSWGASSQGRCRSCTGGWAIHCCRGWDGCSSIRRSGTSIAGFERSAGRPFKNSD